MLTCKCLKKKIFKCGNKSLKANLNLIFYVKDLKSHTVAQVVYALFAHGKKENIVPNYKQVTVLYIFLPLYQHLVVSTWELFPVDLLETFQ